MEDFLNFSDSFSAVGLRDELLSREDKRKFAELQEAAKNENKEAFLRLLDGRTAKSMEYRAELIAVNSRLKTYIMEIIAILEESAPQANSSLLAAFSIEATDEAEEKCDSLAVDGYKCIQALETLYSRCGDAIFELSRAEFKELKFACISLELFWKDRDFVKSFAEKCEDLEKELREELYKSFADLSQNVKYCVDMLNNLCCDMNIYEKKSFLKAVRKYQTALHDISQRL